jgi:hypothetical protein
MQEKSGKHSGHAEAGSIEKEQRSGGVINATPVGEYSDD